MSVKTKEDLIQEWRAKYRYEEHETDGQIWNEITDLSNLYGDLEEDDDWYYIINCLLKDEFGVWFIDEKILKTQVNNAKMNTSNVKAIVLYLGKVIHKGVKKDIKWLEAIDKTKESWIGQNNY